MKRFGVLVVSVVLIAARSASAQDTSRGEVSGGWRYNHAALTPTMSGIAASDHPRGWYADGAFNVSPIFAIVDEVGGFYSNRDFSNTVNGVTATATSDVKLYTFMAGVRLRAPGVPRFVPFGQILFGGEHDASINESTLTVAQRTTRSRREDNSTNLAVAFDGGGTLMFGRIGVRASGGYARFFRTADFETDMNVLRISVGAAFRF